MLYTQNKLAFITVVQILCLFARLDLGFSSACVNKLLQIFCWFEQIAKNEIKTNLVIWKGTLEMKLLYIQLIFII